VEQEELETMGPIDIVVIEFTDGEPTGEIAPIVIDLVDRGIIRILDLVLIAKDEDGVVSGLELADFDGDGTVDLRVFQGAASGILGDDDVSTAGALLEPGSAAAMLMFENRWAAPFAMAVRRAGGRLVDFQRIPVQELLAALEDDQAQVNAG
jgi:hypothetical protein